MANELPELSVKITSDTSGLERGVSASTSKLSKLRGKVAETEKAFLKYGAAAAGAAASMAGLKLVRVTREFDKLNAGLITATGSAKNAEQAFTAIQEFAATTPFSLQQATDGFTKLVNLGLTPSEKALRSYGNTASALGKDLNQMIEAVADAATGEFERLKEFGIKASKQGDQVSLTFQGVTKTIGNSAAEIEGYLMDLGENQFAGAMQERVNSLDGALSNLEDSWNQLFLAVSQEGVGDEITGAVRTATAAIEELQNMIKSGQLQAQIKAIGSSFSGITDDVLNMVQIAEDAMEELSNAGTFGADGITGAFSNMPENIRAFIQIITTEMFALLDKLGAWGEEAADAVKFWDGDTFDIETRLKAIDDARLTSIGVINQEKDASIASVNAQLEGADKLRAKHDAIEAAKKAALEKSGKDRLEDFKVQVEEQDEYGPQITEKQLKEIEKRLKAEEDAAAKMKRIRDAQKNQAISNVAGTFGAIASIMEGGSKKQFERSKKFAMADAAISMYQGIAAGLKLGWPLAIPAVAYAAATGVAQIQNIRSQSFSGGASGGSGASSSTSAAPSAPAAAPQRETQNITTSGISSNNLLSADGLFEAINNGLADGNNINLVVT